MNTKFHLALPCEDIQKTKKFYQEKLGVAIGRQAENWVDVDLFGHQITFTNAGEFNFDFKTYRLGKHILPTFHFGIIVDSTTWQQLYRKMMQDSELDITTEVIFMENKVGEHFSFFLTDPNGYSIEFKSFKKDIEVFMSM